MSVENQALIECLRCLTFTIDGTLPEAEQTNQMRQHLDQSHPYWDLEELSVEVDAYRNNFRLRHKKRHTRACGSCAAPIPLDREFCSDCNATPVLPLSGANTGTESRRQWFGIIGSTLLFVGVFTPIIHIPIAGDVNYFQNGKGDGVLILVLAIVSLIFSVKNNFHYLWFTAGGSLVILLFTFVMFQLRVAEMRDQMNTGLAGNPFRGIADMVVQSIQLQWGWAVLIVGIGFLVAAAVKRDSPQLR